MTKRTPRGPVAPRWQTTRGLRLAAVGLVGGLALAASSCDSEARIEWPKSALTGLHSSGFVPEGGGLDGDLAACEGASGDLTMRFVLTDNNRLPLRLGDEYEGAGVRVDINREDVRFADGALFNVPQGSTDVEGATGYREGPGCEGGCSDGFVCGTAPSMPAEGRLEACYQPGTIAVAGGSSEKVRFVSNLDRSKFFGVLVENSGSVVGSLPPLTATEYDPMGLDVYWDQDGDGTGDIAVTPGGSIGDLASDKLDDRLTAVSNMLAPFNKTNERMNEEGRQLGFGVWHFADSVPQVPRDDGSYWSFGRSAVSSSVSAFKAELRQERDYIGRLADIYDATKDAIEFYSDEEIGAVPGGGRILQQGVDRVLVLVVDGPDDQRDSVDEVIDAARSAGVQVFVVHYDSGYAGEYVARYYDSPEYIEGQEACASDADCKNFEACRAYRGFSSTSGGDTVGDTDTTYCLPHRDVDGRIGPIEDYSKLACATGGGYIYLRSASGLKRELAWLPYAVEGLWEVDVNVDVNDVAQDTPELLLQTFFTAGLAGTDQSEVYQFSQVGGRGIGESDLTVDDTDTRSPIFAVE